ncbi:MAG: preprotein translocase subunit SecY [Fimbriimonadaceae bacterium]
MSMFGASGDMGGPKGLKLSLIETLKQAWADPDLRSRIIFIFAMFGVYVLGAHVPVPLPNVDRDVLADLLSKNPMFQVMDVFGGGSIKRLSIFALGLNPYITASIIIQILTTAFPEWKKELQEGGEYARRQQNKRTRFLTIALCIAQGWGLVQVLAQAAGPTLPRWAMFTTLLFWTAGAFFVLWLGEQISEKGIGNGVSLMIFAGIVVSMPGLGGQMITAINQGAMSWFQAIALVAVFLSVTWFIVYFTSALRQIPIQHMRRQVGTKVMGGKTNYLPIPVNTAGVIPIIFAVSLVLMPAQISTFMPPPNAIGNFFRILSDYLSPGLDFPKGLVGIAIYTALIFFFTYFYTAIQYNVEDISNNLKRAGSFIQGIRPGKQTKDFLDQVISRVTIAGAAFLTVVALIQYIAPAIVGLSPTLNIFRVIGGTSLLIMVSVALETMRQIEANILMKQYGQ